MQAPGQRCNEILLFAVGVEDPRLESPDHLVHFANQPWQALSRFIENRNGNAAELEAGGQFTWVHHDAMGLSWRNSVLLARKREHERFGTTPEIPRHQVQDTTLSGGHTSKNDLSVL